MNPSTRMLLPLFVGAAMLAAGSKLAHAEDAGVPAPERRAQSVEAGPSESATAPHRVESDAGALPHDPPTTPAPHQAASIEPPALVAFVEAEYPPNALAERREGRVVLTLTLDATGSVTEAAVTEAAGAGFDEAARQAALRFRFTPARRNGTPVPARLLYTYEFQLPEAPATGDIRGRIILPAERGRTAFSVEVALTDAAAMRLEAQTDARGRFAFDALRPGRYQLSVHAAGIGEAAASVTVAAGETSTPSLRLRPLQAAARVEVVVAGQSQAERLRQSAQAVHVVETEAAQRQTADLGEVLAREQGIGVRRDGGLGSDTRFSLNGLTDDQIRFFLDGIPLEFAGYPFGIANVPVNAVDRVEVYRGVVPTRFGGDALGGAVNLVTDDRIEGTHGSASYQVGSFGTQRVSLGARHLHEPSGWFVRAGAFFDYADNDYPIDVEAPDERGRLFPARVYRFHDAYRSTGGNLEVGLVDQPRARRLLLRAFVSDYDKEVQNNVVMTRPYGEVEFGELATGASLRYENSFAGGISASVVGGYAHTATEFLDVSHCSYDWFGQCVRERRQAGEIESRPRDEILWEHNAFARINLGWQLHPQHAFQLSLAPTYTTRTGDDRRQQDPSERDPLTAQRDLLTLVSGIEYQVDLFGDRLENITFLKAYFQKVRSEEPLPGGTFSDRDRDTHHFGAGNALRYRFVEWFYAKASYEWATRLPRPDEVFGDGVLVVDNLELQPEVSHNVNVGFTLEVPDTPAGAWRADVNGFLREADQLIVLLGDDRAPSHHNVFGARSIGVESALGWSSPGDYLALDGNLTYLDFRNTSSEGSFGSTEGDRIPNRPYLFANGSARVQFGELAAAEDELALSWNTRYVHEFFRGWESPGLRESKQVVSSQLLHSLALTYITRNRPTELSFTSEIQNLTDHAAFDFYGVQRPGRAAYFKATATF